MKRSEQVAGAVTTLVWEDQEDTMGVRKRRLAWSVGTILISAGLFAVTILSLPHPPMLLEHASKIADTRAWYYSSDYSRNPRYEFYWLSDHRLLYQAAGASGSLSPVTNGGTYFLWNLDTGQHTPLPMLTRRVHAFKQRGEESLRLSPDGQWVYMQAGHHLLMLCRLDGSAYREWNDIQDTSWLPDSRHLAVKLWEKTVKRSVQASQADTPLTGFPPGEVLPNGEALNVYWETSDTNTVHVVRYGKGPAYPKKWQQNLTWPAQSHLEDIAVSPQEDRVACLLLTTYTPPIIQWAQRLLPRIPLHSSVRHEVWVCRLDGTQRRLLGVIPSETGTEESEEVKQFDWLPGGKRLSFVYQETLFTFPGE